MVYLQSTCLKRVVTQDTSCTLTVGSKETTALNVQTSVRVGDAPRRSPYDLAVIKGGCLSDSGSPVSAFMHQIEFSP